MMGLAGLTIQVMLLSVVLLSVLISKGLIATPLLEERSEPQ